MKKEDRYKNIHKLEDELNKHKVQCTCGTKTVMIDADRTICRGCGHWIYKTKKIEFREKLKYELLRGKLSISY